ncbi:MAG: leucine-rich repeat protein, partial [Prevotellaceae bacterium]|nr:leucine-rich repeat protein [Prevotellaceae bacterium]
MQISEIFIEQGVTHIGAHAFEYFENLPGDAVHISESVISIGDYAFSNCHVLSDITLPPSVASIGSYAFSYILSINVVNLSLKPQNISSSVFYYTQTPMLVVSSSAEKAYEKAPVWSAFQHVIGGGIVMSVRVNNPSMGCLHVDREETYGVSALYQGPTTVTCDALRGTWSEFLGWTSNGIIISKKENLGIKLTQDTIIVANFGIRGEFTVDRPNEVPNLHDIKSVTHLKLIGPIDARDVKFMRDNMPYLMELDLSRASVEPYFGSEGTLPYQADYLGAEMPDNSFYDERTKTSKVTLTSIKLPSLRSMGRYVFAGCSGLTSVEMQEVYTIGERAFKDCIALSSINVRNNIIEIGEAAFQNCISLRSVTIPADLKEISDYMFQNCVNLGSATIPEKLARIGNYAFDNCKNLRTVTVSGSRPNLMGIGDNAFQGCTELASISLPQGVDAIGKAAFARCYGLSFVDLPQSLSTISDSTFYHCSELRSISIPSSVTSIGRDAFIFSSLTSIHIPSSVTSIGSRAFARCIGLTSVTINSGLTDIGDDAFSHCGLASITLPSSVTSIGDNAFMGCTSLRNVSLPNSVLFLGSSVFQSCSELTAITIPTSVKVINPSTFYGCSNLASVTLPASLTVIGRQAFEGCYKLTSITIPASVLSIGARAFYNCEVRSVVNYSPTPQILTTDVFTDTLNDIARASLLVPTSAEGAYKRAKVWRNFKTTTGKGVVLSVKVNNAMFGSVTGASSGWYAGNNDVTLKAIPEPGYEFLGWADAMGKMFSANANLSFTLTKDSIITACYGNRKTCAVSAGRLENIGGITNVSHLTLTGSIDARDVKFMRDNMPYLMELDLSEAKIAAYSGGEGPITGYAAYSADAMPKNSFYKEKSKIRLSSVKLPHSLTTIDALAFSGCTELSYVTIPAAVSTIHTCAFCNCHSLVGVTNLSLTPQKITGVFRGDLPLAAKLFVLTSSVGSYKADAEWGKFYSIHPTTTMLRAEYLKTDLSEATYNGTSQSVSATMKTTYTGMGAITVKYDNRTTPPVDAGSYKITAEISSSDVNFFNGPELLLGTFAIKPATPAAAHLSCKLSDTVYCGRPRAVPVKLNDGLTGSGAITVKYNGSLTAPTDAGTYTVTADVAGDKNFAAQAGISLGSF